jgi:hypothetical protein
VCAARQAVSRFCPNVHLSRPFTPQGHRKGTVNLSPSTSYEMLKLVTVLCVAHAAALMPAARPLKLSSKHARAMPLQMSDVKGPKDWAFIKGKVRRTSTPCLDRPAAGVVVAVRLRLRLSCLCRRPRAAPPPFGIAPSLSPRGCASSCAYSQDPSSASHLVCAPAGRSGQGEHVHVPRSQEGRGAGG